MWILIIAFMYGNEPKLHLVTQNFSSLESCEKHVKSKSMQDEIKEMTSVNAVYSVSLICNKMELK